MPIINTAVITAANKVTHVACDQGGALLHGVRLHHAAVAAGVGDIVHRVEVGMIRVMYYKNDEYADDVGCDENHQAQQPSTIT